MSSTQTAAAFYVISSNRMFQGFVNLAVPQFTLHADKAFKTTDFRFAQFVADQIPGSSIRIADPTLGPRVVSDRTGNLLIV